MVFIISIICIETRAQILQRDPIWARHETNRGNRSGSGQIACFDSLVLFIKEKKRIEEN